QVGGKAFPVVEQDLEQMFRREALVVAAQRQSLRRLDEPARALRKFLEIHSMPSTGRAQDQFAWSGSGTRPKTLRFRSNDPSTDMVVAGRTRKSAAPLLA